MLAGNGLIRRANQIAGGVEGFTTQGQDGLNAILGDLCENYDLSLARGLFTFNFNPSLTSLFGSGPYPLPLDYLRTSGSSGAEGVTRAAWFLYPAPNFPNGQPMPLVPIDLGEFDRYPQLNAQGIPSTLATDMGGPLTQRIVLATTAALTAGGTTGTAADATGLYDGLAMAGEGIVPGTTISAVDLITRAFTMSNPATATIAAASVFFGIAPVCYVYPPPIGAYPVFIRYQRKMPPLTDLSKEPWFPNEGYLIDKLAVFQMEITGDSRTPEFEARSSMRLRSYLDLEGDNTNRAQRVQLDARVYGNGAGRNLRITKQIGW